MGLLFMMKISTLNVEKGGMSNVVKLPTIMILTAVNSANQTLLTKTQNVKICSDLDCDWRSKPYISISMHIALLQA